MSSTEPDLDKLDKLERRGKRLRDPEEPRDANAASVSIKRPRTITCLTTTTVLPEISTAVHSDEQNVDVEVKTSRETGDNLANMAMMASNCIRRLDIHFNVDELIPIMTKQNDDHHPCPLYLDDYEHVDASMRAILVHWMMEASTEFCASRETLLMAVMCVDRFLGITILGNGHCQMGTDISKFIVDRGNLQLVGIACLCFCSKLEEKHPPKVRDWCIASDDVYNTRQIVAMETKVLQVLKWSFAHPTAMTWLGMYWHLACRFSLSMRSTRQADEIFAENFNKMAQLIDIAACDVWFLRYYPYTIAAAVFALETCYKSRLLSEQDIFRITGFEYNALLPCMSILCWADRRLKRVSIRSDASSIMQRLAFPKNELRHRQNHNPDILVVLSQLRTEAYKTSLNISTLDQLNNWLKAADVQVVQTTLSGSISSSTTSSFSSTPTTPITDPSADAFATSALSFTLSSSPPSLSLTTETSSNATAPASTPTLILSQTPVADFNGGGATMTVSPRTPVTTRVPPTRFNCSTF